MVDTGNTVVVIEHHLDLIKNADWIIDLGPEAGERGGELVAEGTPEYIASVKSSYTGQYLKNLPGIKANPKAPGWHGSKTGAGPKRKAAVKKKAGAARSKNGATTGKSRKTSASTNGRTAKKPGRRRAKTSAWQ